MTFEKTIAEIRKHQEAQEEQDIYETRLASATTIIREMLVEEQTRTWKLVESLIDGEASRAGINSEAIRERLKEK
jgi:hypothetical protein